MEETRIILDNGGCAAILLLDLSAAFDTVNHQLLVQRLREAGVEGKALRWLQSFLEDRTFTVFEDDVSSKQIHLQCGVPQSSSLSPTLFNIYMRSLAEVVAPWGIHIVTYADDTQLVVSLSRQDQHSLALSSCLVKVWEWMNKSFLKLNPAKTKLMLLGHSAPRELDHLWPSCLGLPASPKKQIKSLGIWLNSNLDLKTQARKVAATWYGLLRMLRRILPLLPSNASRLMIQTLILSRLDYSNGVYLGAPQGTIKILDCPE